MDRDHRVGARLHLGTPSLFVLGFLFIFTLGGLTGVMVAMVPFDWQVHDTYFVVAHLHYVLIGGMVFPLFAAVYYWVPAVSRHALSERLGRWAFWLMFLGLNVTFLPMHLLGLWGMPRRVYAYPAEMGWHTLNLVVTGGAFMLAAGVGVVIFDLIRHLRPSLSRNAGNVWMAGTLEWMPNHHYGTRSIPHIESRYPLWQQRGLERTVEEGLCYLPDAPTGKRETIVTSPIEAAPQYVLRLPGPGWTPFLAAVFTAASFMLLTVKLVWIALTCGAIALVCILAWTWSGDPQSLGPVHVGRGLKLPTYASGPVSHAWWATIILLLVASSLYLSFVFSYIYLWTVAPQVWPMAGQGMPLATWALGVAVLLGVSASCVYTADRMLGRSRAGFAALLLAALVALSAASAVEIIGHWNSGLRPDASAYAALVYLAALLQLQAVAAVVVIGMFTRARLAAGRLDSTRRVTFDSLALLAYYSAGQGLLGALLVHGFPRAMA